MTINDIENACQNFQSYVLVEMINDWVRCSPQPQALVNRLMYAWRHKMSEMFEARATQIFEKSGVITTDRQALEEIAAEAERRIRASFAKMLADSEEVDSLVKQHAAQEDAIQ